MKHILIVVALLMPLSSSANELLDILSELQTASHEIKQGLTEVETQLTELNTAQDEQGKALNDSTEQLTALQSTLNKQKDDLQDAAREWDALKTQIAVFQVATIVGGVAALTAIIVAIVK